MRSITMMPVMRITRLFAIIWSFFFVSAFSKVIFSFDRSAHLPNASNASDPQQNTTPKVIQPDKSGLILFIIKITPTGTKKYRTKLIKKARSFFMSKMLILMTTFLSYTQGREVSTLSYPHLQHRSFYPYSFDNIKLC